MWMNKLDIDKKGNIPLINRILLIHEEQDKEITSLFIPTPF